jgi:FlaA1/EpsC-like NDP-sugar epimerase
MKFVKDKLKMGFFHPRLAVVVHDLGMVVLAWYLAKALRLSLEPASNIDAFRASEIAIVMLIQGAVLWWTGLYRGLWRFASLPDLSNIARGTGFGAIFIGVALFLFDRLSNTPRTTLLIYPLLLTALLGGPRLMYRYWKDHRLDLYGRLDRKRVLVLGAGRAGELLVRDLKSAGKYMAIGFLDDDAKLLGARLHGLPVLGTLADLDRIAREVAAEMLLIAMPSISRPKMQRVVEACEASGLPFRMVPRLQDVVSGKSNFNSLKEVAIEDLLGREPVQLDWTAIRQQLSGKRIMVTGGGGSIGAELCRQAARLGCESLTIIELSEFNLYQIERELKGGFPELQLNVFLGDVGDNATLEFVIGQSKPEVVFHAAAYKHVPMLQQQPREAIRNNVLATLNLAQAVRDAGCDIFVLISTDKAVNPANVMGASKRASELACQMIAKLGKTKFITVRFGNVLDSAGSVVPLFREQIRAGGPVTVTHPEITRYFMTIPEACQLIFQASVLGRGGEIFALDMGEPVLIRYLAEQMIRLAGKEPGRDINIVYTGLREGEKLFEELFYAQENYDSTAHDKIFLAKGRDVFEASRDSASVFARMALATRQFDEMTLRQCLNDLVPELAQMEQQSRRSDYSPNSMPVDSQSVQPGVDRPVP